LNQRWFRVAVFSVSAAIAGFAGALLAGLEGFVSPSDFQTLQSLPLLLVAVVAGVTSVSGAFAGGLLLMLLPVIQATVPSFSGLVFLVIGFGAIMLGRDPNGLVNLFYRVLRAAELRVPVPPRLRAWTGTRGPTSVEAFAAVPDSAETRPESQVAGHGVA
jgi:branched-chain amino acid transport system permease protein